MPKQNTARFSQIVKVFFLAFPLCILIAYTSYYYFSSIHSKSQQKIVIDFIDTFVFPYVISNQDFSLQIELDRVRNILDLQRIEIKDVNHEILAQAGERDKDKSNLLVQHSLSMGNSLLGYSAFSMKKQSKALIIFFILCLSAIGALLIAYATKYIYRPLPCLDNTEPLDEYSMVLICNFHSASNDEEGLQKYLKFLEEHVNHCASHIIDHDNDSISIGFDNHTAAISIAWAAVHYWPQYIENKLEVKAILVNCDRYNADIKEQALYRIEYLRSGSLMLDNQAYQACQQDVEVSPYRCDRSMTINFLVENTPSLKHIIQEHIQTIRQKIS